MVYKGFDLNTAEDGHTIYYIKSPLLWHQYRRDVMLSDFSHTRFWQANHCHITITQIKGNSKNLGLVSSLSGWKQPTNYAFILCILCKVYIKLKIFISKKYISVTKISWLTALRKYFYIFWEPNEMTWAAQKPN